MKRLLLALVTLMFVVAPGAAPAQTVVLDGVGDCGGVPFGETLALGAGAHDIEWVSGAYSLFSSNGQNGGLTWIGAVRVYVHATDDSITIGNPGTWYPTQAAAAAAAIGHYPLNLAGPTNVTFWLSDGGGCGDNRGTITLEVGATTATESANWGRVKTLFRD